MSVWMVSFVGIFPYRNVLYPAFLSIESRSASLFSLPLWLESSSSMIAMTVRSFVQMTKSATFLSKRTLVLSSFVVIKAEKATCARTMQPGTAAVSSWYIFCSCGLSGARFLMFLRSLSGVSSLCFFWFLLIANMVAIASMASTIISIVDIVLVVMFFVGKL